MTSAERRRLKKIGLIVTRLHELEQSMRNAVGAPVEASIERSPEDVLKDLRQLMATGDVPEELRREVLSLQKELQALSERKTKGT